MQVQNRWHLTPEEVRPGEGDCIAGNVHLTPEEGRSSGGDCIAGDV